MANSFSSAASLTERFLAPSVAQVSNPNPEIEEVGIDNASDNDDEVLSVGGVSLPPSPQPVAAVTSGNQTVLAHPQPDEMESAITPREPATASSRVEQNAVLECDHKASIKVSDVEAHLNARRTMRSSPEEVPADECPRQLEEGDVELPRASPLSAQDPSSSPFEPDVDGGECTSPQQSAALKFSIDNILNPNFGRSLLPASTTTAVTRELLHRHPHLYCHPLITAAKEMLLAVTAAEMSPAAPAPASNYLVRDNTHQSTPNHLPFNPHLAALQINNSTMNQQPHVLSSTSGIAGKNNSANKLSSNAFYATWRSINTNNRSDHVSCLTPPSSAGTVMDLSLRSANGYAAGGSLSSPSRGSASPGGISTCSSSSSGDSSSQHQSSFTGTGTVANPPAPFTTKLAANAGALVGSASATPANNESSTESGSASQPNLLWPAWVYCTRYSDRPSSGPRARRIRKKDKKPDEKRPRTAFTAEQLARLKTEFNENRYLTEKRRQDLARELQLHENQIKIWFQNKRAKIKKASGQKNPLALQLMAQGLYNHSTIPLRDDEDIDSME